MKKAIMLFFTLLSIQVTTLAQQANKTLDYIQTKDGRKLYGKIKEVNPSEGVVIQTYGEGDNIKLKYEEIEIIKMAEKITEEPKPDHARFLNSISIVKNQAFVKKNKDNEYLFNDPNAIGFSSYGFHYKPTLVSKKNNRYYSLLLGYEAGKNINWIPLGLEVKFLKIIKNKSKVAFNVGANGYFIKQKVNAFTNLTGSQIDSYETNRNLASGSVNLGLGYHYKLKKNIILFVDCNYKWMDFGFQAYKVIPLSIQYGRPLYGSNAPAYYDYYKINESLKFQSLELRIGVFFN